MNVQSCINFSRVDSTVNVTVVGGKPIALPGFLYNLQSYDAEIGGGESLKTELKSLSFLFGGP